MAEQNIQENIDEKKQASVSAAPISDASIPVASVSAAPISATSIPANSSNEEIDNDDDLEDTEYNIEWKKNKAIIKQVYYDPNITDKLVNYGNNLILYYEKKIDEVTKLIEGKSSDLKKNFVGDVTIQDEQKKKIAIMIDSDPSTANMAFDEKEELIKGYYDKIGNKSSDVMDKDYEDRNRTIKYILLIKEYEDLISKIRKAIKSEDVVELKLKADDGFNWDPDFLIELGTEPDVKTGGYRPKRRFNKKYVGGDQSIDYPNLSTQYSILMGNPFLDPEFATAILMCEVSLQNLIGNPMEADRGAVRQAFSQLDQVINRMMLGLGMREGSIQKGGQGNVWGKIASAATGVLSGLVNTFTMALGKRIGLYHYDEDTEEWVSSFDDVNRYDNLDSATIEAIKKLPQTLVPNSDAAKALFETSKPETQQKMIETGLINPIADSAEAVDLFVNSDLKTQQQMMTDGLITKNSFKNNANGINDIMQKTTDIDKILDYIDKGLINPNQKVYVGDSLGGNIPIIKAVEKKIIDYPKDEKFKILMTGLIANGANTTDVDNGIIKTALNNTLGNTDINVIQQHKVEANNVIKKAITNMSPDQLSLDPTPQPTGSSEPILQQFDTEAAQIEGEQRALVIEGINRQQENLKKWNGQQEKLKTLGEELETNIEEIKEAGKGYEEQIVEIQKRIEQSATDIKDASKASIDAFTTQVNTAQQDILNLQNKITELNDASVKAQQEIEDKNTENKDLDSQIIKIDGELKPIEDNNAEIKKKIFDEKPTNTNFGKLATNHEIFYYNYIEPNFLKNNLYQFIQLGKKLDSAPAWRSKISKLIVGYISSYVTDPNDATKSVNVIPSYDYFNLVLMGTPGVGKSYTSKLIAEALKWCGFLTIGKIKEVKKPDIVGSYTGQTAPKVYKELTQGLGNVIFIDEAYSIAGARDEVKKTFNEFGQEALDAITDYTSEHIGLFGFIVAGYEYEMRNQFLNVNIGLPRRFPTILTLRRYDMKAFWKILETAIIKFCPKYQVNHHHHACFEILNLMFNYQCAPNPKLKLSKNWLAMWEGYQLQNLLLNIKVNLTLDNKNSDPENVVSVPILQLADFQNKLKGIMDTDISSGSIEVLPCKFLDNNKEIDENSKMITDTFVKAYLTNKFCNIRNGDFFRSQADNLTKFGQIMLTNKIINPENKFKTNQDIGAFGNRDWIEYVYFSLYFTENPNKQENPVKNIRYDCVDTMETMETIEEVANSFGSIGQDPNQINQTHQNLSEYGYVIGGSKKKRGHTQKHKNSKKNKNTKRKQNKKGNKISRRKHQNKNKRRKTYKQRGGSVTTDNLSEIYFLFETILDIINNYNPENKDDIHNKIEEFMETFRKVTITPLNFNEFTVTDLKEEIINFDYLHEEFLKMAQKNDQTIDSFNNEMQKFLWNEILLKLYSQIFKDVLNDNTLKNDANNLNTFITAYGTANNVTMKTYDDPNKIWNVIFKNLKTIINSTPFKKQMEESIDKKASELKETLGTLLGINPPNRGPNQKFLNTFITKYNLDEENLPSELKKTTTWIIKFNYMINYIKNLPASNEAVVTAKQPEIDQNASNPAIENVNENTKEIDPNASNQAIIPDNKEDVTTIENKPNIDPNLSEQPLQKITEVIDTQVEKYESIKTVPKNLVFDIVDINFSYFNDVKEIIDTIQKSSVYTNKTVDKKSADDVLFQKFLKVYDDLLKKCTGENIVINVSDVFPKFFNTYLLLACYIVALKEADKPLGKFDVDDWWFFTADDFKQIRNSLNYVDVLTQFTKDLPNITLLASTQQEITSDIGNITSDISKVASNTAKIISNAASTALTKTTDAATNLINEINPNS